MATRKSTTLPGALELTDVEVLPAEAILVKAGAGKHKFRYTTGPFSLPQNAGSLDWVLLNNDTTIQKAVVTVFRCAINGPKTALPPGPLQVTLQPSHTTHNANTYPAGFVYEVVVECNSQLLFPYVSVWPGNFGVNIPGTGINSGTWLSKMP